MFDREVVFTLRFVFKSLSRNLLRTSLTGVATMVLVLVVTLVVTVLWFLDQVTSAKSKDFKATVTERWQIPSQMPFSYAGPLEDGAAREKGDVRPQDAMTWQFYGGTIDKTKNTRESIVFFFCMDPAKLMTVERDSQGHPLRDQDGKLRYSTMMDGLDEFTDSQLLALDDACKTMIREPYKVVIGRERLEALNKHVGERIKVSSLNYKDIDLEVEIMGTFPEGRYNQSAVLNRDYLNHALDQYEKDHKQKHPLADKSLNLVWLRVPDTKTFNKVAAQIEHSPSFTTPAVKCETASSGIASFLDAYRDLLWGMRCLLTPAILATMAVVIATAISISVRERRTEMAILKVLGFGPGQLMVLVVVEALVVGWASGLLSSVLTYVYIDWGLGGLKFPVAFFGIFRIPEQALAWGPLIASGAAVAGSLLPAWSARSVKAAEVFSKVA
ncbi:MAG: ABC transporter permease [Planctomycetes bacterium]|nr:ABC transporter permease [Planctomycetota bacterium]